MFLVLSTIMVPMFHTNYQGCWLCNECCFRWYVVEQSTINSRLVLQLSRTRFIHERFFCKAIIFQSETFHFTEYLKNGSNLFIKKLQLQARNVQNSTDVQNLLWSFKYPLMFQNQGTYHNSLNKYCANFTFSLCWPNITFILFNLNTPAVVKFLWIYC